MQTRALRRLFGTGVVYAVLVRGFLALMGFPPGLGYNPTYDGKSGIAAWTFLIAELATDVALPALAVYWAYAGFWRRTAAATRTFAAVLLLDNVIYVGSTLMIPTDTADGAFGTTIACGLPQLPSAVICLSIIVVGSAAPAPIRSRAVADLAWRRTRPTWNR